MHFYLFVVCHDHGSHRHYIWEDPFHLCGHRPRQFKVYPVSYLGGAKLGCQMLFGTECHLLIHITVQFKIYLFYLTLFFLTLTETLEGHGLFPFHRASQGQQFAGLSGVSCSLLLFYLIVVKLALQHKWRFHSPYFVRLSMNSRGTWFPLLT